LQAAQIQALTQACKRVCLPNRTTDRQEAQQLTAVWQNWRFRASYASFVGKQTLALRMDFGAENRQLRQAANRYR